MNIWAGTKAVSLVVSLLGLTIVAAAQSASVHSRITQPIDEKNLVTLKGNTHPLAAPEFDRGAAPGNLPMNRMLMVLNHTPEQETAIRTLLAEQQNQGSPYFHQWLTPAQYGAMFGPSDADIQKITSWLESHGFQVAQVSPAKHIIEFSGTASQVEEAFHTSIHAYVVNGESHWANASDPQIPAALAPVVTGIKSLHNFYEKPTSHFAGIFRHDTRTGVTQQISGPQFTFTQNNQTFFGLGPADFATIYHVQPLWNEGIDGRGESIAIVQESNINISDVHTFRQLFGLPVNDPEVILDGPDPGIIPGIEPEAVIDVTWSGAVAKNAKIKMVVSASTNTTSGISLSAVYIADHNVASISSMSFGNCELHQGTAGNAFWNAVWEQAAAEGISAFVSAGDGGSAGCDNFDTAHFARDGLAVSGDASTPFDIAVGGTDFGGNFFNSAAFWAATNNPTTGQSALSYIPELPWNDSCANSLFAFIGGTTDPIVNCNNSAFSSFLNIVGGSGGASSCISSTGGQLSTCSGGYAKPSWQTGLGVPADGVRDIPDVSLFASNGFLGSFYIICEADLTVDGMCNLNNGLNDFAGFGGTSVSSPAFAGILALVDQETHSRQGLANFVLYKLAADQASNLPKCNVNAGPMLTTAPAASCIFNDITADTNTVPCLSGSPNCRTEGSDTLGVLSGYDSGVGYDLTTGLGSVNAFNLVHNWKNVTFAPTATLLKVQPERLIHGQAANVEVEVTAASGTPSGQIALKTDNEDLAGDLTLGPNGTISTTTHLLPGGPHFVTADYFGDGTFAQSDSNPVPVFVFPEPSTTKTSIFAINPLTGRPAPFTTGQYGSFLFVRADVAGKSGFGFATGQVRFTDNGHAIPGDPFRLNSEGNTENPNSIDNFSVGTHTILADYDGDASFFPSHAQLVTFLINPAPTTTTLKASASTAAAGTSVTITATVDTTAAGDANLPTGEVTFLAGSTKLGTVSVAGGNDANGFADAVAAITTSNLPVGVDAITAVYSGDRNYTHSAATAITITITAAP